MRQTTRTLQVSAVILFLSLLLLSLAAPTKAELGILRVSSSGGAAEEFCIGYNSYWGNEIKTKPTFVWIPVVAKPFNACTVQHTDLKENTVLVSERGNCTFREKANNALGAGAVGLIVINNAEEFGILQPSPGTLNGTSLVATNFTVVGMSASDRERFLSRIKEDRDAKISIYTPSSFPLDPNVIFVFLVSVGMVVASSYWANSSERLHCFSTNDETEEPEEQRKSKRKKEEEEEHEVFEITGRFALCFVFFACFVILLLYFLYKYLAYLIIGVFMLGATSSLHMIIMSFLNSVFHLRNKIKRSVHIPLCGVVSLCSIVVLLVCVIPPVVWFVFRQSRERWILQDLLGMSIIASVIKTAKLPSLKIAAILLSLFFAYDVFFVFITPLFTKNGDSIMEDVATGGSSGSTERLPLALLFPRVFDKFDRLCGFESFSMIGYGDIVIPSLLVSYCLRVDYHILSSATMAKKKKKVIRLYFLSVSVAYAVGLILTYAGLLLLESAQPALFYLVPCTMLTVVVLGWRRNELLLLWKGIDHRDEHEQTGLTPLEDLSSEKDLGLEESGNVSINGDIMVREDEDLTNV